MLGLVTTLLVLGVILFTMIAGWAVFENVSAKIILIFIILSALLIFGSATIIATNTPTMKEKCKNAHISYELVETTAQYTDYTEEQVFEFFSIVADSCEPYEAIRLLDNDLADSQIMSIIELSDMKQKEIDNE